MRKLLKWIFIIGGGLIVLICLGLILIPFFVDMNKYKEPIENKISESIGRDFSIKGNLELSLFPWAGISFKDLYIGNPEGFEEENFFRVKEFEARVKLLPLITKDIQVKRFILDGANLNYITLKSGRTNIDGLIPEDTSEPETQKPSETSEKSKSPIKSLDIGEFSITNGTVTMVDKAQDSRNQISEITLQLKNVSFDQPIGIQFSAKINKKPFRADGKIGPLGKPLGKNDIPLNMTVTVLEEIKTLFTGTLSQLQQTPGFEITVETKPFSLKNVLAELGQPDALNPSDPSVLKKISFYTRIKGNTQAVTLKDGKIVIDDTNIHFSGSAKEFDKPNLAFNADLDQMDVDRYLPAKASSPEKAEQPKKTSEKPASSEDKPDYTLFRSMVLEVNLKADALKAGNIKTQNLQVEIHGNKGIFNLDPMAFDMYEGVVSAKARADFKTDTPAMRFSMDATDIRSNPLVVDFMEKDVIEGNLNADMNFNMKGIEPEQVKRTLNGSGKLVFKNGAIKGINLTSMARNVKTAFGKASEEESGGRTDFAELIIPFDITNGVVNTSDTKLSSPLIRLTAAGKADLNTEKLAFRIEPKFVTTLSGQGDTSERSGYKVPVLVTGTFSSPKFAPDVGSMVKDQLKKKMKDQKGFKELFDKMSSSGNDNGDSSETQKNGEDSAKELFKNIPFGR